MFEVDDEITTPPLKNCRLFIDNCHQKPNEGNNLINLNCSGRAIDVEGGGHALIRYSSTWSDNAKHVILT